VKLYVELNKKKAVFSSDSLTFIVVALWLKVNPNLVQVIRRRRNVKEKNTDRAEEVEKLLSNLEIEDL